jgi:hypothetical protein
VSGPILMKDPIGRVAVSVHVSLCKAESGT